MEGLMKPVPGDWGWSGPAAELDWDYNSNPTAHNYSLAYRKLRGLGVDHELAVQGAQQRIYGRVLSKNPEPENARNRNFGVGPLSSPLPALRAAIEQAEAAQSEKGMSGRRMAMRWGLPVAGGVLGLYGLTALLQPRAEVEPEEYAAAR
jgi:hypothetical protein